MRPNTKKRYHLKTKTKRRIQRRTQRRRRQMKGGTIFSWIRKKTSSGIEAESTVIAPEVGRTTPEDGSAAPEFDFIKPDLNLYKTISIVKRIGQRSANGYIYSLTANDKNEKINTENVLNEEFSFTDNEYNNYVFKIAQDNQADNLFYEYIAGKYINEFINYVPFFTKTYGLFKYDKSFIDLFKSKTDITTDTLKKFKNKTNLVPIDIPDDIVDDISNDSETTQNNGFKENFKNICGGEYCILIEKAENIQDMDDLAQNALFITNDLVKIFYQLYMTLDMFKKRFTHYDLHRNNVLICKLPNNKYIQHQYQYRNDFVLFESEYYIKIIDYGRCFFESMNGVNTSTKALNIACNIPGCNNTECGVCGKKCGFRRDNESRTITTSVANPVADLRYINAWLKKVTSPYFNYFKKYIITKKEEIVDITSLHLILKQFVKENYTGATEASREYRNYYYKEENKLKTLYIDVDNLQVGINNLNEMNYTI